MATLHPCALVVKRTVLYPRSLLGSLNTPCHLMLLRPPPVVASAMRSLVCFSIVYPWFNAGHEELLPTRLALICDEHPHNDIQFRVSAVWRTVVPRAMLNPLRSKYPLFVHPSNVSAKWTLTTWYMPHPPWWESTRPYVITSLQVLQGAHITRHHYCTQSVTPLGLNTLSLGCWQ